MDPDFWHQRWRDNRIGFHRDRVMPLLEQHWPSLGLAPGSRVFVPLCGKSLDMAWLAAQGYRVLGVELSQIAVEQFFDEHDLAPTTRESPLGTHFTAGPIEIICGDALALDARTLTDCVGVYDRAALIALPRTMRDAYVRELQARLPAGCRGLLITLEYPPGEKAGPPFPVDADEVRRLYDRDWQVEQLERRDILATEPSFAAEGVTALHTSVWQMEKRHL
ncbi:thiopurine S-methyltransferase [Luteimonas soli]|uniref:Thiopurine S-methyltransferase n=1 Tax=Luteimonas soli TaxID=1648966 RepID=A0ABV7XQY5_9GAMM